MLTFIQTNRLNIAAFEVPIKVNGKLNRLVAKDGLQGIHVAALLEIIEGKAMTKVMASPFFHGWVELGIKEVPVEKVELPYKGYQAVKDLLNW